jgi:hypothetical protein
VLNVRRNFRKRHCGAPHGTVDVVENDVAGAVVDLGRLGDFSVFETIYRRYGNDRRPCGKYTEYKKESEDDDEYESPEPLRQPFYFRHMFYNAMFDTMAFGIARQMPNLMEDRPPIFLDRMRSLSLYIVSFRHIKHQSTRSCIFIMRLGVSIGCVLDV